MYLARSCSTRNKRLGRVSVEKQSTLCVIFPWDIEWPTLAVHQRLMHLATRYRVVLLTRRHAHLTEELDARLEVVRLPFALPRRYPDILAFYLLLPFAIYALHRCVQFNCVYTFRDMSSFFGLPARWALNTRWVADIYDDPALELIRHRALSPGSLRVRAIGLVVSLLRLCLRYADLVITIGTRCDEELPDLLIREYGVPPDRLVPVPNGVDLGSVTESPLAERDNVFTVFYVGSLGVLHGTAVLLDAFDRLVAVVSAARLVLAGPLVGAEADLYRREFTRRPYVEYLGPTHPDQTHDLMAASDVCVYPFLSSPVTECVYPVKVLEYLAVGRPVIASRLSGVSKLIRHGYNGLLVEPGDAESLAGALLRVYEDAPLRKKLAHAARASAGPYDWPVINARVSRRIDEVLGT